MTARGMSAGTAKTAKRVECEARQPGRVSDAPKLYRFFTLTRTELVEIVVGSFVSAVMIYAALPDDGRLPQAAPSLSRLRVQPAPRLDPDGIQSTIAKGERQ